MARISLVFVGIILFCTTILAAQEPPKLIERSDEPIHIKADQLQTDTKQSTATFIGKVTARQGDLVIYADRMVVHYGSSGGSVEKVECTGGVRIVQKNRIGTAAKGVYDNILGKIVLSGDPKVYQGEDMISGAEITYYIADQRSVVTGAPSVRVEAVIYPKGKKDGSSAP